MIVGKRLAIVCIFIITLLVSGCTSEGPPRYAAAFTEYGDTPQVKEASTQSGKTSEFEFEINRTNLTKVEFNLGWSDDSGDGCDDIFELTIVSASPSATYEPQQTVQGTGTIDLTVVLAPTPPHKESNDRQELENYMGSYVHERGIGDWKVSVTCVNTQPDCPDPKATDGGNSWVLTVNILYFEGKLMEND